MDPTCQNFWPMHGGKYLGLVSFGLELYDKVSFAQDLVTKTKRERERKRERARERSSHRSSQERVRKGSRSEGGKEEGE